MKHLGSRLALLGVLWLLLGGLASCSLLDIIGENTRRTAEAKASAELQLTFQRLAERDQAAIERDKFLLLNEQQNHHAEELSRQWYMAMVTAMRITPAGAIESARSVRQPLSFIGTIGATGLGVGLVIVGAILTAFVVVLRRGAS